MRSIALLLPLCLLACSASKDDDAATTDGGRADTASTGLDLDAGFSAEAEPGDVGGPCTDLIDVVFVLDVSSSMDFVLDKLGAEIDSVVTAANGLAKDAHFGFIGYADNHRLDTTGPLEGGKVHTAGSTLKAGFDAFKKTYTLNNRNPGDGPSGPTTQNPICEENALDALMGAANEFPWRPNATRVIILATDDTFLERPDNYGDRDGDGKTDKTDFPREGNYPAKATLAETVSALQTARARVFSFTRLKEPGAFDLGKCGTGRRLPWSAINQGWSQPYKTAKPIPTATAGKNYDLDQVKAGKLGLATTINEVVLDSRCKPPIY